MDLTFYEMESLDSIFLSIYPKRICADTFMTM